MGDFTYMNKDTIDEYLICEMCQKPFIDPICLPDPCGKTFCSACIRPNLENHSKNCTDCNSKTLLNKDLKPESLIVKRMLDRLPVQCNRCFKQKIQRSKFSEHSKNECPKRIVFCPANDVLCPWNGFYDQLYQHHQNCSHEKIRSDLTKLIENMKKFQLLKEKFQNLTDEFEQQKVRIQEMKTEKEKLVKENAELKELTQDKKTIQDQRDQYKSERDTFENVLKDINDNLLSKNSLIKKLEEENKTLQENIEQLKLVQTENKTLHDRCEQQMQQNDSLNLEFQSLLEKLSIYETNNQQLHQYCGQIKEDNEKFNHQCHQYELDIGRLNLRNQELQTLIADCEHKLEQIQSENQQLDEQSLQYQAVIEELTIDIKRLEGKLYAPTVVKEINKVGVQNAKLGELIEKCQTSLLVQLYGERIHDSDIEMVINIGMIKKRCEALILHNNLLTTFSISTLSSSLKINTTLKKLVISNNNLSDVSVKYLSDALSFNNSTLETLILSSNKITDQGLMHLSNMLKANQTLTVLGLQNNEITDKGVQYLSPIIQFKNKVLVELALYSNPFITDASIDCIINMIQNSQSLNRFWIWDCHLSKQGQQKLQQSIESKIDFNLQL